MNTINRPLPVVDPESAPFWSAAKNHELKIPYCTQCQRHFFPPRGVCPHCLGSSIEWKVASGRGTIYSYTIAHRPAHPAFKDDVPYALALIELEEGPRLLTRIVRSAHEDLSIGKPVEVTWEPVSDDIVLPYFTLTNERE